MATADKLIANDIIRALVGNLDEHGEITAHLQERTENYALDLTDHRVSVGEHGMTATLRFNDGSEFLVTIERTR